MCRNIQEPIFKDALYTAQHVLHVQLSDLCDVQFVVQVVIVIFFDEVNLIFIRFWAFFLNRGLFLRRLLGLCLLWLVFLLTALAGLGCQRITIFFHHYKTIGGHVKNDIIIRYEVSSASEEHFLTSHMPLFSTHYLPSFAP